jgi:hypothetical protein
MRTLLALVATFAVACSGSTASSGDGGVEPPPIHARDYNQGCAQASDCVLVSEGDVCGCYSETCGANTAINRSDQAKWEADVQSRQRSCPNPSGIACPALCAYAEAYCRQGTCASCGGPGCAKGDAGADGG